MEDRIIPKSTNDDSQIKRSTASGSALRREIPRWKAVFYGSLCILAFFAIWWILTRGDRVEDRILNKNTVPSPTETFREFQSLWFDGELTRNVIASLTRVTTGFALAALIGIPLGVLCGSYPWMRALLAPATIFGRNIPIAALIPLTYAFFGTGELQKMLFIFIACVAFIIDDTATSIEEVGSRYIDTAYTLGANQWQIILKVIFPLALSNIFNSLRLLYGLAFGYIMLVESVANADTSGGLGFIILNAQRRSHPAWIILVLLIIPFLALAIDRLLFLVQRQLFPHQYGGAGYLRKAVTIYFRWWEDFKAVFRKSVDYDRLHPAQVQTSKPDKTN